MNSLAQQAVAAALAGHWQEATRLNKQILSQGNQDLDALNRLARAYIELGRTKNALTAYKKALRLDPYNTIAQKAVERLSQIRGKAKLNNTPAVAAPATSFLEEPGKTKTVSLIHLGAPNTLNRLNIGDLVHLVPHAHRVSVENHDSQYIGRLPDDISRRIIRLSRAGNQYEAYIRSVAPDSVRIFIREVARGQTVSDIQSFPPTEKPNYVAFTPPDLVHDERPDMGDDETG